MKYEAMNAKTAGDKLPALIESGEYAAEIKLDGYRAISENGRFYSRLGNDLTDKLPHLRLPDNMVLDGELLFGKNSSDVTTVLGCKATKSLQLQESEKVRFVVFDILELDGKDLTLLPWEDRREQLGQAYWKLSAAIRQYVELSAVFVHPQNAITWAEESGAEGVMLKNIHEEYYPGKRPEGVWYKVKKHDTADVKITGFTPGKGKFAGLIGSIEFVDEKGNTGSCGGMTDDERKLFSFNSYEFVGQTIEIGYMERTKAGGYRHPVFKGLRSDKVIN